MVINKNKPSSNDYLKDILAIVEKLVSSAIATVDPFSEIIYIKRTDWTRIKIKCRQTKVKDNGAVMFSVKYAMRFQHYTIPLLQIDFCVHCCVY